MADTCTITVFFDDPFWAVLYERDTEGGYEVCFGAEPKDYKVYETLLAHWRELAFSPSLPAEERRAEHHLNPKRARRRPAGSCPEFRSGPGRRRP